ncbi:MAG: tRNA (adenosine(37)-N6)-threonylcarbamoyltransferase complex ATPase subunit type 1 TsaE [Patescibacteria group bacterium]|nr:tRNA (adenosine(37)-N6)-threonylcarbamoyltransferase complex ATPase subunit type 1 TsaE [Patescibacteria group bacterium]
MKSFSSKDTEKCGFEVATRLVKKKRRTRAIVVTLRGQLGTGKTTFVRGMFRALNVRRRVTSPTFVLMKRYPAPFGVKGDGNNICELYHLDLYRVRGSSMVKELKLKEILRNPQNLICIEWAEHGGRSILKNVVCVTFAHGVCENERIITVSYGKN